MRIKALLLSVVLVLCFAEIGQTQLRFSGVRLGYLNPKGSKAGMMLGVDVTNQMDESLELGINVSAFRKSYEQTSEIARTVSSGGLVESTVQKELEFTTFFLPIMAEAVAHLGRDRSHFFLNGGLGYEMLWNKENNLQEGKKDTRYYHGFAWLASAGYQIGLGLHSGLTAEIFYHGATVKRNESKNTAGLPVWSEVDLSGFGFRGGLRWGLW